MKLLSTLGPVSTWMGDRLIAHC